MIQSRCTLCGGGTLCTAVGLATLARPGRKLVKPVRTANFLGCVFQWRCFSVAMKHPTSEVHDTPNERHAARCQHVNLKPHMQKKRSMLLSRAHGNTRNEPAEAESKEEIRSLVSAKNDCSHRLCKSCEHQVLKGPCTGKREAHAPHQRSRSRSILPAPPTLSCWTKRNYQHNTRRRHRSFREQAANNIPSICI